MTNEMLNQLIESAKKNLKAHKELLPTFFVGNDEEINIVGATFETDVHKDAVASMIRKLVREMKATFVLFIAESWTLAQEDTPDFMANRKKYPHVSDHPKAYDIVVFQLETKTGHRMGTAKITKDRGLEEIEWRDCEVGTMGGRFAHFLGPKGVKNETH